MSSANITSGGNIDFQVARTDGSRRESILVLVMVLAPIGLAVVIMAVGVSIMAAWQMVHGMPVDLPTPANMRL